MMAVVVKCRKVFSTNFTLIKSLTFCVCDEIPGNCEWSNMSLAHVSTIWGLSTIGMFPLFSDFTESESKP